MAPDEPLQPREVILARIRKALLPSEVEPAAQESWATIPRTYRITSHAPANAIRDLLTDRLRDYDAHVLHCNQTDITQAIAQRLTCRGAGKFLVPPGLPASLLPPAFTYIHDADLSLAHLDGCAGVITTCTIAIAETGTIVLQHAPGQGRRALSLVPDYHLCLVDAAQVVATVPQAIAALQPTATLPTTFISGPSATADIEMTRIKGVHGPRFLDVILIHHPA